MTRTKKEVRKELTELEQELARLKGQSYHTDAQKDAIKLKERQIESLKRVLDASPEKMEYKPHWSEDMEYIRAVRTFKAVFPHK